MTSADTATTPDHVDVLIVGAGISGIGAACHLRRRMPHKTLALFEAREAIGGTWDLFRYPGIRSDSDLYTFGYEFKPWIRENAIASADEILAYLRETIDEHRLSPDIHLGHRVLGAEWSSADARWTVRLQRPDGAVVRTTCEFFVCASGYYDYDRGYAPDFEGQEDFLGPVIHPQQWPQDFVAAGQRIVVIGSGATAVTLIPALVERGAEVTMVQRSPSYVMSVPANDPIANGLRRALPKRHAYRASRSVMRARMRWLYKVSVWRPEVVRRGLRWMAKRQLPAGYPIDTHFNPSYNPWDERLCLVPDGDLFKAISAGRASVATDRIVRFTERGVLLVSGRELQADAIVTATGLNLLAFGGLQLVVDGAPVRFPDEIAYKATMLSNVPNFIPIFGYTKEASWTLKVDLVGRYLCRLLSHMEARGYDSVTPRAADSALERRPLLDLRSGYVQRGVGQFPKAGTREPWTIDLYAGDCARLLNDPIPDPALHFARRPATSAERALAQPGASA